MTFWNSLSYDVQLLLVMIAFALPIVLMIGMFTWRDAKRRGMNHILWAIIAGLSPALMGFIIYLLVRSTYTHLLCTACGHSVKPTDGSCPGCGAKLRPLCPHCGNPVENGWKSCPTCASVLPESQETTPTVRPRNKALWAMLAMLIVVPLVVTYLSYRYIIPDTPARYFHTRYTPDTSPNESIVDPIYLEPESWFSYSLTDQDGTTTVSQTSDGFYGGSYTVTTPGGGRTNWKKVGGGGIDHSGTKTQFFDFYREGHGISGDYYRDEQGHLTLITLGIGTHPDYNAPKPLYEVDLRFSYDENGKLIRQEAIRLDFQIVYESYDTYLWNTDTRRYATYTYDENGRLTRAEEYDHTDTLTGYTEYTWSLDSSVRFAQHFTHEGHLTDWSVTEFDSRGRLLLQEFYDADNMLIQKAEFSYDVVACLMRPMNLLKLAAIWMGMLFFAGYIVSSSNKETY